MNLKSAPLGAAGRVMRTAVAERVLQVVLLAGGLWALAVVCGATQAQAQAQAQAAPIPTQVVSAPTELPLPSAAPEPQRPAAELPSQAPLDIAGSGTETSATETGSPAEAASPRTGDAARTPEPRLALPDSEAVNSTSSSSSSPVVTTSPDATAGTAPTADPTRTLDSATDSGRDPAADNAPASTPSRTALEAAPLRPTTPLSTATSLPAAVIRAPAGPTPSDSSDTPAPATFPTLAVPSELAAFASSAVAFTSPSLLPRIGRLGALPDVRALPLVQRLGEWTRGPVVAAPARPGDQLGGETPQAGRLPAASATDREAGHAEATGPLGPHHLLTHASPAATALTPATATDASRTGGAGGRWPFPGGGLPGGSVAATVAEAGSARHTDAQGVAFFSHGARAALIRGAVAPGQVPPVRERHRDILEFPG